MHSKAVETSLGVEKAHDELIDDEVALEKLSASKTYDYSGAASKTDPAEIALVRKLDCRIMPMIWAMYFLNYLDKNAIASARLNGLEDDIGLTGSQYNTCISILFVGYLLMQLPSNMLMASKKIRPSIYMGCCMALWAVCSACTALVQNYRGLVIARFFLGVAEAPFYPGALFLLSIFYTRKEIATRIAILYSANILSTAFSGLIAAAIFSTIDGAHGIEGWRWLFIIEGVVTFGIALLSMWRCQTIPRRHAGFPKNLKIAFSDPRLYLLGLMQNLHLSSAGFNNFFPTVVGTLGFDRTVTLVLTCPPFVFAAIFGPLLALSSGRFNERTWHITAGMAIGVSGFAIAAATLNTAARYVACFLFSAGVYSVNSCILGWVSATLGQTAEKKAISLGFVNIVANASYIYTPYLYPSSDGPRYLPAMGANAGFATGTVICAWGLKIWLMAENKKLKASAGDGGLAYAY
ncbi:hypothetical protein CLAIMM_09398 [Cladophialophora immunda]|nr:hypothetical protein CLAIMM_09398 [Cladophialophora immunda]